MWIRLKYIVFAVSMLLASSCAEKVSPELPDKQSIPERLEVDCFGRYYDFRISPSLAGQFHVECDADWIELTFDEVPDDGIIEFLAERNSGDIGRTATIVFRNINDKAADARTVVYQKGLGEYPGNSDENPLSDCRIGWGFDVFLEYMDLKSQRERVIDCDFLQSEFDSDTSFLSIQTTMRSRTDMTVTSAYSLQEMSKMLTEKSISTSNILGFKKTISRYSKITSSSLDESLFGYAVYTKTVASRNMDIGVLSYIFENDRFISSGKLPFTKEFYEIYNRINSAGADGADALIAEMLDRFGTHIIVSADIGGKIDYAVTFDKRATSDLELNSTQQARYVFGQMTSESASEELKASVTSNIKNENSIKIYGGSSESREKISQNIASADQDAHIYPEILAEWSSSISISSVDDIASNKNLDLVSFSFIPIWDLFKDNAIKGRIQYMVLKKSENSNCDFTDEQLGLNNYYLDLDAVPEFVTFDSESDATLVKRLYVDGKPFVEACSEYVPKIRSDRRIVVLYPIVNGNTIHGQGFFMGDGEGNRPAVLSFSKGDIYVNPMEEFGYNDKITKLYYLNGNLYPKDYGIATKPMAGNMSVRELRLKLMSYNQIQELPIVKIGSTYWTRENVRIRMFFGMYDEPGSSYFSYYEKLFDENTPDQRYYASPFCSSDSWFLGQNHAYAASWRVPFRDDALNMKEYLGSNMEVLFKGQASGFEAEFSGCYCRYDDFTNKDFKKYDIRYENEYCFIAFRNDNGKAMALALSDKYKMSFTQEISRVRNLYPVRLCSDSGHI